MPSHPAIIRPDTPYTFTARHYLAYTILTKRLPDHCESCRCGDDPFLAQPFDGLGQYLARYRSSESGDGASVAADEAQVRGLVDAWLRSRDDMSYPFFKLLLRRISESQELAELRGSRRGMLHMLNQLGEHCWDLRSYVSLVHLPSPACSDHNPGAASSNNEESRRKVRSAGGCTPDVLAR